VPRDRGRAARSDNWTSTYTKARASTAIDIDNWARAKTGARPERCGICQP